MSEENTFVDSQKKQLKQKLLPKGKSRQFLERTGIVRMGGKVIDWWRKTSKKRVEYYLTGPDEGFRRILEKLESDPEYKAFIVTNFTVTHTPYEELYVPEFLERYPAESDGLSAEEIDHYTQLFHRKEMALEWNYPQAIEDLNLSDEEVSKLSRVIELLYKSNVNHLDGLFGGVVDEVRAHGLLDESLIVFTSDHGETFNREGTLFKWGHGMQLAPEVLNISLIIRSNLADVKAGSYDHVTRSIDVFPTMMGLSGAPIGDDRGVQGVDLSGALRGTEEPPQLLAYSHTSVLGHVIHKQIQMTNERDLLGKYFPSEDVDLIWVSVRDGDMVYKLRSLDGANWGYQAFDLAKDPGELVDLYDPENRVHGEMAGRLDGYKARLVKNYRDLQSGDGERLLSEEDEIRHLKSLGYIQ